MEEKDTNEFDKALIKTYGTGIVNQLEVLKKKFAVVVAAHLFAGSQGDNPLTKVNRAIAKAIE